MWIRCLYSTQFSHCNNGNRKIYDIEKITLYLKEEHGTLVMFLIYGVINNL